MKQQLVGLTFGFLFGVAATSAFASDTTEGTHIIGDEESALGLAITPWQEEQPSRIDRPPMLLSPVEQSVGAAEMRDRVQTQQMISAYRRSHVDPR
jgi:hypothetical protein